ncbi:hypothetical protein ALC56_09569 [Trachymyrmex septentrionalis]|uniref:Uncharacterized protein n=1 Tax=Trachymyrmex septentrionalis TaxID=34720 RepID=A0A195F6D8_9HYME|nr:hypothetical protein ALC56_09569 [Trachymyrmex septentrionalis]
MVPVELCITRSGFYVADMVPDLRAIEPRTEVAASQINRREGVTEVLLETSFAFDLVTAAWRDVMVQQHPLAIRIYVLSRTLLNIIYSTSPEH